MKHVDLVSHLLLFAHTPGQLDLSRRCHLQHASACTKLCTCLTTFDVLFLLCSRGPLHVSALLGLLGFGAQAEALKPLQLSGTPSQQPLPAASPALSPPPAFSALPHNGAGTHVGGDTDR